MMHHCHVEKIKMSSGVQRYYLCNERLTPYGGLCVTLWERNGSWMVRDSGGNFAAFKSRAAAERWIAKERCAR